MMKIYLGQNKVADQYAEFEQSHSSPIFVIALGPYTVEVDVNELPKLVEAARNHLTLVTRPVHGA